VFVSLCISCIIVHNVGSVYYILLLLCPCITYSIMSPMYPILYSYGGGAVCCRSIALHAALLACIAALQ